jgi:hypothetical protein
MLFTPKGIDDWKKVSFDSSNYHGHEIQIVMDSTNRAGNRIYLNNCRIFEAQNPPLILSQINQPELPFIQIRAKKNLLLK